MSESVGSLEGISLLVPPLDGDGIVDRLAVMMGDTTMIQHREAQRDTVALAARLGATILNDTTGDPDFYSRYLEQPGAYALAGSNKLRQQIIGRLTSLVDSPVRQPGRVSYPEYALRPSFGFPLVLACDIDGGQSKYLIEQQAQLDKFKGLNEYFSSQPIDDLFEVREFIPTPSDHYTSYRLLTSATGELIAAGLLYSSHTKPENKVITLPTYMPWDPPAASKLAALEIPGNPYFLYARDVRSNIQQGGRCVPLMGGNQARTIDAHEATILSDHGIDPDNVGVPSKLLEQAAYIGKTVSKYFGLVTGIDFLQHAETGEFYFLEINGGPGTRTFTDCWLGGDDTLSTGDMERAMLRRCLASLALGKK